MGILSLELQPFTVQLKFLPSCMVVICFETALLHLSIPSFLLLPAYTLTM